MPTIGVPLLALVEEHRTGRLMLLELHRCVCVCVCLCVWGGGWGA
jgi:hypothetical protein